MSYLCHILDGHLRGKLRVWRRERHPLVCYLLGMRTGCGYKSGLWREIDLDSKSPHHDICVTLGKLLNLSEPHILLTEIGIKIPSLKGCGRVRWDNGHKGLSTTFAH